MRRRTSRRAYTKIRNRVKSSWSKISAGAGALAFLQQVTAKDMEGTAGLPIDQKAKTFMNALSGRITGYNPFGGNVPQTINVGGIFNRWSGIGLGAILYGMVPVRALPHKGKAKTLGKSLLTGGILGGLFDAPNLSSPNLLQPGNGGSSSMVVGSTQ